MRTCTQFKYAVPIFLFLTPSHSTLTLPHTLPHSNLTPHSPSYLITLPPSPSHPHPPTLTPTHPPTLPPSPSHPHPHSPSHPPTLTPHSPSHPAGCLWPLSPPRAQHSLLRPQEPQHSSLPVPHTTGESPGQNLGRSGRSLRDREEPSGHGGRVL